MAAFLVVLAFDVVDFFVDGDVFAVDFFGAVLLDLAVDDVAEAFGAALAVDRVVDLVAVLAVDAFFAVALAGALAVVDFVDFAGALVAVRVVDFAAVLAGAFAAVLVVDLVAVFGAALVVDFAVVARFVVVRVLAAFVVVAGAFFAVVDRVAAGFEPARDVLLAGLAAVAVVVRRVVLAVDARLAGAFGSLR